MNGTAARTALIVVGSFAVALAAAWLLTGFVGPSDRGLRCQRAPVAQCEVLQTRFFGLAGNTSFSVPLDEIRGAKTLVPNANHSGGRAAAGSFRVALLLDPRTPYPEYPVLGYDFASVADAATQRLNDYFSDPKAPSIEIMIDFFSPILLVEIAATVALAVLALMLRTRRRR